MLDNTTPKISQIMCHSVCCAMHALPSMLLFNFSSSNMACLLTYGSARVCSRWTYIVFSKKKRLVVYCSFREKITVYSRRQCGERNKLGLELKLNLSLGRAHKSRFSCVFTVASSSNSKRYLHKLYERICENIYLSTISDADTFNESGKNCARCENEM